MYASRFLAIVLCASAALGLAIPAPSADEGDIIIREEEKTDDDIIIRRQEASYIEWQPRQKVYVPAPLEDA